MRNIKKTGNNKMIDLDPNTSIMMLNYKWSKNTTETKIVNYRLSTRHPFHI